MLKLKMLHLIQIFSQETDDDAFQKLFDRIRKYEDISDKMENEIGRYLGQVADAHLSDETKGKIRGMLRQIGELESVGDSGYNLARILQRKKENKIAFSPEQEQGIIQMYGLVDEAASRMNVLLQGRKEDYSIENRALIQVTTDGEPLEGYNCALNDVAILKRDTASMISIRASINGDYLTTYQADGLVISSPTGSTAYSLSNGGPIIVPGTKVISMTAVAPHSMNIRPIVLADSSEITLTVESRSHNFLIAIDGRSEKCKEGTKLTLRRAPYDVKVVKRSDQRYFNTLREKMMWGIDVR